MLGFALSAPGASPVTPMPGLIHPFLLFVLGVVAAAGMILLLPSRQREAPLRTIGGVVLLAVGLILAVLLARAAGGMNVYFWIFSALAIFGAVRVVTHPRPVYSALYFVLTVMASAGLFVLMWAEFMAAALVLIYAGAILVTYVFVIMLAAEAHPSASSGPVQQLAEHDAQSREPVLASAVGFALMGLVLFVVFDRSAPIAVGESASGGGSESSATVAAAAVPPATATAAEPPAVAGVGVGAGVGAAPRQIENSSQPDEFTPVGETQMLGYFLFRKQLVNLELAGLLLTVAMVGAIVIARKRVVTLEAMHAGAGAMETVIAPATPIDDNPHSIPVVGTENPRQKEFPQT
jgi:NADH-quinone oxidoreductase subunit J